jgi:hypothetical protein
MKRSSVICCQRNTGKYIVAAYEIYIGFDSRRTQAIKFFLFGKLAFFFLISLNLPTNLVCINYMKTSIVYKCFSLETAT